MKLPLSLIIIFVILNYICLSQTINIHSISHNRQSNGGHYTLDGAQMSSAGRLKLLSDTNFGTDGIYPKLVNIIDGYTTSNSLTQVFNLPYDDIFFFGTFDKSESTLIQFTSNEIDSLYNWSKKGGKLIICGSSSPFGYNPAVLNSKWGFQISHLNPSTFVPNTVGLTTDIFNGPFGSVSSANQGGLAQGYFNSLPNTVSVIATNASNQPTIIMDCETLDLIVADVDGYSSLDGSVSTGSVVSNNQDKYLANTFVFMDKLQKLPTITTNGTSLSVSNIYNSYQWYQDDVAINDSNSNNITVREDGQYYVKVTVNGGCEVKSNIILADSTLGFQGNNSENTGLQIYPNPSNSLFYIQCPASQNFSVSVSDTRGRKVYESKNITETTAIDFINFSSGVYFVTAVNENMVLTGKLIKE